MPKRIDLTGHVYSKLTVISRAECRGKSKVWLCLCECGNYTEVRHGDIRNGKTTSCGCTHKKLLSIRQKTHGMTGTKTYRIWKNITQRCNNKTASHWKDYGGRGITICKKWESFEAFFADMGECPEGRSIDRINNNGNYAPDNCRWATAKQQANNTRRNRHITFLGLTLTVSQWAERLNLTPQCLKARVFVNNWPIEKAFFTPVNHSRTSQP